MEEIRVNEYVRSVLGRIGKVTKIESNTNTRFLYEDKSLITIDKNVYKHSFNIIDLIEVGDYVNGHKVEEIWEDAEHYRLAGCDYMFQITDNEIKSIVTKEMMKSVEYRID